MSGLIPQGFIDNLLARIDIIDVIDKRIHLKKAGRNYSACCPFHQEKTPSFSVSPEKQFYHCFGCGVSGNAIGFLMAFEGLDFPSAVERLASAAGLEVPRQALSEQAERSLGKQRDILALLKQAECFFRERLAESSYAMNYLTSRGLTPKVIEDFGIGYAPEGWHLLMQHMLATGWQESQLIESGMVVEREGGGRCYDRFRDRIMFPIRDLKGQVIAFGGRVLGSEKPKYLNSPETPVFSKGSELYGLYEANHSKSRLERLVVVEGYMDVVALSQYGVTHAVASLGTAIGALQIEKAFRFYTEVVFCFDGDEAGRRAATKALGVCLDLLTTGRVVKFLFLSEGEDPDSYIRQRGVDAFLAILDMAQPLSMYLFEYLQEGLSLISAEGRAGLITKALPALSRIPDGPFRKQLFAELALRSQADILTLEQGAGCAERKNVPLGQRVVEAELPLYMQSHLVVSDVDLNHKSEETRSNRQKKDTESPASAIEKSAAQLMLAFPDLADRIIDDVGQLDRPSIGLSLRGLVELAQLLRSNPHASHSRLLGLWHGLYKESELAGFLSELLERECLITDPALGLKEFEDQMAYLRIVSNRDMPLDTIIEISRQRALTGSEKQQLRQLLTTKMIN